MKNKDFVVFIITHGRPEKVVTYESLLKYGYTGKIYLIIDNLDTTREQYQEKYHNQVIVFDKLKVAETFDIADNFDGYRSTSYARNACFDIAKDLGVTYFLVLDDDYTSFKFKFDNNLDFISNKYIKSLDNVFDIVLKYFISTEKITSIAFAQEGDFIGGPNSSFVDKVKLKRKCMNSFFCSTQRRFTFFSRMNEDVNTYIKLGNTGTLFFTLNQVALNQISTQVTAGGMTELYKQAGTYVKSFYSVMYCPSSVKVKRLVVGFRRIHHFINWEKTVPKILSERYKKQ